MRTDLLKLVADNLEKVPDDKFDMDVWKCGTAACAIGHACSLPAIAERGLYLAPEGPGQREMIPVFGFATYFEAVAKAFEIELHEAKFLFSGLQYDNDKVSKEEVVQRIRKFINDTQEWTNYAI